MLRYLKNFRSIVQILALTFFATVALQGCNHLEPGAITVNCSEDQGGRGGCGTPISPSGEIAQNTGKPVVVVLFAHLLE